MSKGLSKFQSKILVFLQKEPDSFHTKKAIAYRMFKEEWEENQAKKRDEAIKEYTDKPTEYNKMVVQFHGMHYSQADAPDQDFEQYWTETRRFSMRRALANLEKRGLLEAKHVVHRQHAENQYRIRVSPKQG